MRRNVWMMLSLALATWVATSRPAAAQGAREDARDGERKTPAPALAPPPAPVDPGGKRMQHLLQLWAQQSMRLKSLDVSIRRVDTSDAWGDEEYEGRAMFKTPNLAWLDFQKVVKAKAKEKTIVPHERIVCTGKEVWQYRSDTHQIFIYELGRQEQKRALQEGPLPFLFNFRADDARKRYRMSLVSEDASSHVIAVMPLLDVDKECFSKAYIKLDRKWLLPTRVVLIDPAGKSKKDFILTGIKPNAVVMDDNFRGQKLPAPWKIHVNPKGENPAQPLGQAAQAGQPQPAKRQGRFR